LTPTPQPAEGVTYAEKISKAETRIDWAKPARDVHNHIRGLSPFPGAWFEFEGVRVKALRSTLGAGSGAPGTALDGDLTIACGEGAVRLVEVQREGKKAMSAEEFLRGTAVTKGTQVS
jgi:methionyl-tRNA formyltransferase